MGLQIISYLCLIVFLSAVGLRIRKQWKMPVHFRWELYPVQHEPGEKASYGGSYMEEVNWWEKKRRKSLTNEIKYMVPEILLLRGLREENRPLWNVSFPFHFGLYLLFATLFLLFLGAIILFSGGKVSPGAGGFSSSSALPDDRDGIFRIDLGNLGRHRAHSSAPEGSQFEELLKPPGFREPFSIPPLLRGKFAGMALL